MVDAAVVAGHADCLVTTNLKDFPVDFFGPPGIEVRSLERFIIAQRDLDPVSVMTALKLMQRQWRKPVATVEEFAQAFDRVGMPAVTEQLQMASALV